jgi:D-methionine transport system ATP-binding protein
LLDFVGISDKAGAYPAQLSGGQKQRVGIARALAAHPKILLADEATSALDPETTKDVLDLLRRVNRDMAVTVVVITHAMSVVQYLCDRVAVMEAGKVIEAGSVYDLFSDGRHPSTRRFVQTALQDRPSPETLAQLRAKHPGRLVEVRPGDHDPAGVDIGGATSGLNLKVNAVFGTLTQVEGLPFGSLTLELDGHHDQVAQAVGRLKQGGARVTDLGTAASPQPDPDWQVGQ